MAIKSGLTVAFKALMGQINSLTAMQNELSGEKKVHRQHHEHPKPQPWFRHWDSYELMLTLSVSSSDWTDIIEADILWHIIRMVMQYISYYRMALLHYYVSYHVTSYSAIPTATGLRNTFFHISPRYYLSREEKGVFIFEAFPLKAEQIHEFTKSIFSFVYLSTSATCN